MVEVMTLMSPVLERWRRGSARPLMTLGPVLTRRTNVVVAEVVVVAACPPEMTVPAAAVAAIAVIVAAAGHDPWRRLSPRTPVLGACAVHEETK